jgi:hypothetical protein
MAAKKSAPKTRQTQAQRLLEVARKARAGSGNTFARATGKASLVKNGRKASRIG